MDAEAPSTAAEAVRRPCVVVLGMHRSGTSALAGALSRGCVDFGSRLMPARPDNPRGFYEHLGVVRLNDALLAACGSAWDDPRPFVPAAEPPESLAPTLATAGAEIPSAFAADRRPDAPWGIKDPRLARLVPWWLPIWDRWQVEPRFVFVRRAPFEIAASLHARNRMPVVKGLALTCRYWLEAERSTREQPRVATDYDLLMSDWRGCFQGLEQVLGMPLRATADETAIDAFLARTLRHHASGDHDFAGLPYADLAQRIWSRLPAAFAGDLDAQCDLDTAHRQLDVIGAALADAELPWLQPASSLVPVGATTDRAPARAIAAPPAAYRPGDPIDFTLGGNSPLYTVSGWSAPERAGTWTLGARAELALRWHDPEPPSSPADGWMLALTLRPLVVPERLPSQTLTLRCGSDLLATWEFTLPRFVTLEVPFDPAVIPVSGRLEFSLEIMAPRSPRSLGTSDDGRLLGACLRTMRISRR